MKTLLINNGDTIGIGIACFLILVLFGIAVWYVLNGFRKQHEEYKKWEKETDDYLDIHFGRKEDKES